MAAKIQLTRSDLRRAASSLKHIFKDSVDANRTTYVYDGEIKNFHGKGAASVRRFFAPAQYAEGNGTKASLVPLRRMNSTVDRTLRAAIKIMENEGDGAAPLAWSELPKNASETMKAFVRYAHAIK